MLRAGFDVASMSGTDPAAWQRAVLHWQRTQAPDAGLVQALLDGRASAGAWAHAGEDLLRIDLGAAALVLEHALSQFPQDAQLHYLHGNAMRLTGRPEPAEAALRTALRLEPAHPLAALSLAHLLREQGRLAALADVVMEAWQAQPRSLATDRSTLAFLIECERFAEAGRLVEALLASHPGDAALHARAGEIALVEGRFDAARVHLRRALELDPSQSATWLRLAHTHRFDSPDDPDLALLEDGATRADAGSDAAVAIDFALGKAFDDLLRPTEACTHWRRANAARRATHPWSAEAWQAEVEARLAAAPLTGLEPGATPTPIFIVGLPRSGTTLCASLLGRDARIRARGELNWIAALARQLGPRPRADALAAAAHLYLRQLRQDDAPAQFYIDKNPLNFRHLGLIAALFPQARLIHCRRSLRDTALSLWSQHFAHPDMAWSYDWNDIAAFTRGYQRLMAAADPRLQRFDLDYEDLAREPDATLARLHQFLDLDRDSASAQAAATEVFATASVWQARQGVHTGSIQRWRRFETLLPELTRLFPA